MSFINVGFFGTAGGISTGGVWTIDEPLSRAVRSAGFDPSTFDMMRWSIGASRWAIGRYLIAEDTFEQFFPEGFNAATGFRIGDIFFDRMFMRIPQPVLISETQGVGYAIEVVDERFEWSRIRVADARFNISTDDKEVRYDSSERGSEFLEHTPRTAITAVLTAASIETASFDLPTGITELDDVDNLREFNLSGSSVGVVIDAILSMCGCVLTAFPRNDYPGSAGFRYRVERILDGAVGVGTLLNDFGVDLLGGGLLSPIGLAEPAPEISKVVTGKVQRLDSEFPSSIDVAFPLAVKSGQGYTFNDETEANANRNFVTDKFWIINSTGTGGLPANVAGNGQTIRIYDTKWAIVADDSSVENESALSTRADVVAKRYYDRYRSGAGSLLLRGVNQVVPYSGAAEITWIVSEAGPHTRVRGRIDDPLFGYGHSEKLSSLDVIATGGVRTIQRPDGRLLLDSPVVSGAGMTPILIHASLHDPIEMIDKQWFDEAILNEFNEWEPKAGGLTSLVDSDVFKNPAINYGDFKSSTNVPGSSPNHPLALMQEHIDKDGQTVRLFQYMPFFPVILTLIGGSNGDASSPPTYTYMMKDFGGGVIGDSGINPVQPLFRQANIGPVLSAPNGSIGIAFYFDGSAFLYMAPEQLQIGLCSPP